MRVSLVRSCTEVFGDTSLCQQKALTALLSDMKLKVQIPDIKFQTEIRYHSQLTPLPVSLGTSSLFLFSQTEKKNIGSAVGVLTLFPLCTSSHLSHLPNFPCMDNNWATQCLSMNLHCLWILESTISSSIHQRSTENTPAPKEMDRHTEFFAEGKESHRLGSYFIPIRGLDPSETFHKPSRRQEPRNSRLSSVFARGTT